MRLMPSIVAVYLLVCVVAWQSQPVRAQAGEHGRGIWDGAYAAAQAERGHGRFTSLCRRCHNDDLNGSERGPALRGEKFLMNWDAQDLGRLFEKIQGTMPPDSPSSLPDDEYVDVMAYILQANGFPPGKSPVSIDELASIVMVRKAGEAPADVPNFRLVQVIGCLTRESDKEWLLTRTTDPVLTTDQPSTPTALQQAAGQPLGTHAFRLVGAQTFRPEEHKGQKVQAKGLIYRAPNKDRINLISLEMLGATCGN